MQKTRILIVGSFPKSKNKVYGGIQRSCEILLKSNEFNSFEIIPFDSSQISNPPPKLLIRSFYAILRIIKFPFIITFYKPKSILIFCSDGLSAIEKGVMVWISRSIGIPSLIFPRAGNLINQSKNSNFLLQLVSFLFKKANIFLAQGNQWRDYASDYLNIHNKKIHIINNWTASSELIKLGEERIFHTNLSKPKILFVGWLEKEKGTNEILNALINLHKKNQDFKMTFIGDGSIRNQVNNFIKNNNLEDKILMLGWMGHDKLKNYLKSSDIFILPSWKEGMPNALIEALACGLPSIVSPVGVIPDYLTNLENCIFVSPRDSDSLEKSILLLINDFELRKKISKNGNLLAKNVFLTDNSLSKLSSIIKQLAV